MGIKPILFNTEMVRAILEDRKCMTRRVVKPRYGGSLEVYKDLARTPRLCERCGTLNRGLRPPYQISDILWVRETWRKRAVADNSGNIYAYKADENEWYAENDKSTRWSPSIHMPREAARIFLRVTGVRVERLQEIDEDGAIAEGCSAGHFETTGGPWGVEDNPDEWTAREDFSRVWDSTVKPVDRDRYGWAANPWVWVIEFERCGKPEVV